MEIIYLGEGFIHESIMTYLFSFHFYVILLKISFFSFILFNIGFEIISLKI